MALPETCSSIGDCHRIQLHTRRFIHVSRRNPNQATSRWQNNALITADLRIPPATVTISRQNPAKQTTISAFTCLSTLQAASSLGHSAVMSIINQENAVTELVGVQRRRSNDCRGEMRNKTADRRQPPT